MVQHSPQQFMKVIQWIDPDAHAIAVDAADVDSEIDTIGFRYALFIVNVGDSAGTWTLQVEASPTTGGTFANVTGAVFSILVATDDVRLIGVLDLQGSTLNKNRFIQLAANTIATGAIDLGMTVILIAPVDAHRYIDISGAAGVGDTPVFEV